MKKVILLAVIFLLIIPPAISAKGEVIVEPTPQFHNDFLKIITTEGDSVSYSFTIRNIGNETIKNQKLWYELTGGHKIESINIPELKPEANITLEGVRLYLGRSGDYVLKFGINTDGVKGIRHIGNEVTVNGNIDTSNLVQHHFHTYDITEIVSIVGMFVALVIVIAGFIRWLGNKSKK